MITVQSTQGGQCSAQVRDLKPSVQPTKTTEAVVRDNERDKTKTVKGAVSQIETVQPEVKFATSKPSMTLMTGQSWVPSTNGGNPSSAFQVPQFANTQKQYFPSQGPNFIKVKGIIFRFREKQLALTADVEAMFLQLKVPPADCKVHRFLCRESNTEPIVVYEYGRHSFGAKSSPTCVNYALQQVGGDSRDDNGMVASLNYRNFYKDNFLKSVASAEEAVDVYRNLRKSSADGGFQLTKWICNSEKVMEEIPSEDRSAVLSKTFQAEPLAPSIFGLKWNVESHRLECCRGTEIEVPAKITHRIVLSHESSMYDPLGLFSLFTIRMRLLLKGIWKKHGQS